MSVLNSRNSAEASDSLATLTAAATGLAALVYSVNVVEVFAPEGAADLLGHVQMAGALLVIAGFGPLMIFLKSRGGRPAGRGTSGGYLDALYRQASLTAFSATLAFMIVLSLFERTVLVHLSAETAVDLLITFALAIFSASFFVINRFSRLDPGAESDA